jgi:hypothetical protein
VFIGRKIDEDVLRRQLKACLVTPENNERNV